MDTSSKQVLAKALQESEAQKSAIVEGFPGIMILFGPDMKAKWLNKHSLDKFPDAIGSNCHQIFCVRSDVCDTCAFRKCLDSGQIESNIQRISKSDDSDEDIVFDIVASPVKGEFGTITGIIVIAQNVTEQYNLERQLRHSQKMEAIGTLAGGVAHDFNNVLTPIMGYTEIIRLKLNQDSYESNAVFDYLEEILKASKRAKSLVEQVLTFSRSMEKKAVLQYLHPVVKEVMKLMRVTLPSTIIIKEEIEANCGRVLIDPVQMHQVLINLCTNGADAMAGQHGELTVKLSNAKFSGDGKEMLELSVTDTGCGINEENIERIFEPYFTTKEKTRGTGMGLAMVHGIVSRQGGYVQVESEVDVGSVFKVFLPVAKKETAVEQVVVLGDLVGGAGKIILVDDEEQVVQVTGEILKSLGYSVVGQTSPQQALTLFSENPNGYDLILTDLTMPELTGLELSDKIKKIREDIPIILFTGYSDQVSKNAAKEAGIDEYCMKPISMRDLSAVVGKFLGDGSTSPLSKQHL